MAATGSSASAWPSWRACHRPVSLSGMSRWPWMRVSTFQAVSPWRMAMMRVAWSMVGGVSGLWQEFGAQLARPLGRAWKARECLVEQHAVDGRVAGPYVLVYGRGFVHHLLAGGVAQYQADLAVV